LRKGGFIVRRPLRVLFLLCLLSLSGAAACRSGKVVSPAPADSEPPPLKGIRVAGNKLVDLTGRPVQITGVNRMGTEYACIGKRGIFEGVDTPDGNEQTLNAMLTWKINAVRVPLNEDCWLGTKPGLDPAYTGPRYQAAISEWVNAITGKGMVAIVDLHWAAPNGVTADGQQPMANRDNSPAFWSQVARTFKDNPSVMFDLFNEPYIDGDPIGRRQPWSIWRDGGTLRVHNSRQQPTRSTYQAAGMQELVDAVRSTGAANPIMLSGLSHSQDLSQIVNFLPGDPAGQLVASFHPYPGRPCAWTDESCLAAQMDAVMPTMPLISSELGRDDCTTTDVEAILDFLDNYAGGSGYLAWVWTITFTPCGQNSWGLIEDYSDGTPTTTGAAFRHHFQNRPDIGDLQEQP
jgi:endoglucanase